MLKKLAALLVLPLLAGPLSAQAAPYGDLDVSAKVDEGIASTQEIIGLGMTSKLWDFDASILLSSDGKYGSDIANFRNSHSFFKNYILMETGYSTLHLDPVTFQVGRIRQQDSFDSPYSLFVNSARPSTMGAVLSYHDALITAESRWVRLNDRSGLGGDVTPAWGINGGTAFPDRGANIKTFSLTLGHQKFGVQDAAVYTNRSFDLEYFVSPMPGYFVQYFGGTAGRPWTTNQTDNYIMGAFWTWDEADFHWGAQLLIDDFSFYMFSAKLFPNNPWKAAWSVGGDWNTEYGRWGIYHAGALKYTFEPIDANATSQSGSAYGYSLFPDTRFGLNGGFSALSIEDNALGYRHGENNAALMATYQNHWGTVAVDSQLEFLLAGSNAPANPWQDATGSNEVGTHWIDDPVLEKSLTSTTTVRWGLGDWTVYGSLTLGYHWNVLALVDPTAPSAGWQVNASGIDQYSQIWKPSNDNKAVATLVLGAAYHWDIGATLHAWGLTPP